MSARMQSRVPSFMRTSGHENYAPDSKQLINDLRGRMNTIKQSAHFYEALIKEPGLLTSEQALSEAANNLAQAHGKALDLLFDQVMGEGFDEDERYKKERFVKGVMAEPVARLVAELWKEGEHDPEKLGRLGAALMGGMLDEMEQTPQTAFDNDLMLDQHQMSEARALTQCSGTLLRLSALSAPTQALFCGPQRGVEGLKATLREGLRERADLSAQALLRLSGIDQGAVGQERFEKEYSIAYRNQIGVAGQLLGECLEKAEKSLKRTLHRMDKSEQKAYLANQPNHPEGRLAEDAFDLLDRVRPAPEDDLKQEDANESRSANRP